MSKIKNFFVLFFLIYASTSFAVSKNISCVTAGGDTLEIVAGKHLTGLIYFKTLQVNPRKYEIDMGSTYGKSIYEATTFFPNSSNATRLGELWFDRPTERPGLNAGRVLLYFNPGAVALMFFCVEK